MGLNPAAPPPRAPLEPPPPGCVRLLPWEPPAEGAAELESACPGRARGARGELAVRLRGLQQAQLWSFPPGPPSPPRNRALPPLQQAWSPPEKRTFPPKRGVQLKRGALPPEPPPPAPPDEMPPPGKRQRSRSPEQVPPPFPLPHQGLWPPQHGDAWTPPPRLGPPLERQDQRSLAAPRPPPPPPGPSEVTLGGGGSGRAPPPPSPAPTVCVPCAPPRAPPRHPQS
ncbi:basic proline-rich protein-like, partial [Pezoporus flaviventris]|uniref:basic proline-rich protein-like n=1 Tax=Pezoporus flaviventris TaxID=889875 RepID=UPI002AB02CF1